MSMKKTLGGDRLGSGKKMKVELHGYQRSSHNMGYIFRSTMSAGTLVPFMVEIGLPGDTFDIDLEADIKSHPTIGPLFGSYKVQLDVFTAALRLYQGQLHNNKLGIGLDMGKVKLPRIELTAPEIPVVTLDGNTPDNVQINPSCILSYLGIRGIGNPLLDTGTKRFFNGTALLVYWDVVKNYFSNKQEENAYVIHQDITVVDKSVDEITVESINTTPITILTLSAVATPTWLVTKRNYVWRIKYTGTAPNLKDITIETANLGQLVLEDVLTNVTDDGIDTITGYWKIPYPSQGTGVYYWSYVDTSISPINAPKATPFPLLDIDRMREKILAATETSAPFEITAVADVNNIEPYNMLMHYEEIANLPYKYSQEGLALKTYQSDIFNNWLNEEWIDGAFGINEITRVDTSGGSFTMDDIQLAKKVYDMLNRVAVSGGTYQDWLDAVYTHERATQPETPVYHGGLIRELVFQEVVSNAESSSEGDSQPLGTLGGKGVMGQKKKGGKIVIKVDEPCYIMGIISLTPRIDYSQGNRWDVHLQSLDDLHKPAMDEIGFQDLITEQMAWWDTSFNGTEWIQKSAGKQPAWINYMTNYNRTYGNFADQNNEMFMTLNRRYEYDNLLLGIKDLTTYIDPVKFNYSFAQTALDAQNFWAQISIDMTARRKMSAKLMPNL